MADDRRTKTDFGDWKKNSSAPERPVLGRSPSSFQTRSPRRILVVEDNVDGARSLAELLAAMGHHVDYAINGYAALGMVKRFRPEVVLLDIGLPGMDGFEVCSQIKRDPETRGVRVVMVSAYTEERHRSRASAAGCDAHLAKPVGIEDLERELTEA